MMPGMVGIYEVRERVYASQAFPRMEFSLEELAEAHRQMYNMKAVVPLPQSYLDSHRIAGRQMSRDDIVGFYEAMEISKEEAAERAQTN